jgi:hypothetical protein
MSKKHFESLAEAIRATRPQPVDTMSGKEWTPVQHKAREDQWYAMISALSAVLGRENMRFDEDRFREACYRRAD